MESYVSNVNRNGSDLLETLEFKTPSPLTSTSESENENAEIIEKTNVPTTKRKPEDEREICHLIPGYVTEESTASSKNSSGESSPSTLKKRLHNLPAPSDALKLADRVAALNRRIRRERDVYLHLQGLSNRIEEKDELEIVTTGSSTATFVLENDAKRKSKDARTRRRERMSLESFQSDRRLLSAPETQILKNVRENCQEKLKNLQKFNRNLEELNEDIISKKKKKKEELFSDISRTDLPIDHDLTSMLDKFQDSDRTRNLQRNCSASTTRPFNENALRSCADQQETCFKFGTEIVHDNTTDNCLSPERNVTIPTSPSFGDCPNFVSRSRMPLKFGGYRPSQSGIFIHNLSSDSESDTASEKTVRKVLSGHNVPTSDFRDTDGIADQEVQFRILADDESRKDLDLISITSCSPCPVKVTEIQQLGSASSSERKDRLIAANDNDCLMRIPTLTIESQELSRSISAGSREDSSKEPLDVNALIRALSDVSLKQNCPANDENSPISCESRLSKSSGLKSAERTPATNRSMRSLTPLETREVCCSSKSSQNSRLLHRRSTNSFGSNDRNPRTHTRILVQGPEELADESNGPNSSRKYADENFFEDVPEYKSPITRTVETNLMRTKHSSRISNIGEPAFLHEFSKDTSIKPLTSRTEGSLSQSSRSSCMSTRSFKSLSSSSKICGKKKSNSRVKVEKLEDLQILDRQSFESSKICQMSEEDSLFGANDDEIFGHRCEIQVDTLSRRSLESSTSRNSEKTSRNYCTDKCLEESSSRSTKASNSRARSNKSMYRTEALDGTETAIRRKSLDNSTGSRVKSINRSNVDNCSASSDESKTLVRTCIRIDDDLQAERNEVCVPNANVKIPKREPEDGVTLNRTNGKDILSNIRAKSCCCSESESAESSFKDKFIEATKDTTKVTKVNGEVKAEEIERTCLGTADLTANFDSSVSSCRRPSIGRKCCNKAASNCSSSSTSRETLDSLRNTDDLQFTSVLPCIDTHYESQGPVSRTRSFLTNDSHSASKNEGIYSEALPDREIFKRIVKNSPRNTRDSKSLGLDSNELKTPTKLYRKSSNDSNKRTTDISNTRMAQNGPDLKSKSSNAPISVHTTDPMSSKSMNANEHSQNSNEGSEGSNAISEIARFESCIRAVRRDSKELLTEGKSREDVASGRDEKSMRTTFTTRYSKNNYCSCKRPSSLPDVDVQSPRETCRTMKKKEKESEDQTRFSPRIFVCSNCRTQCEPEAYLCTPRSTKLSNKNCSWSRDTRKAAESVEKLRSPLVKLEDDRFVIPSRSKATENDQFDENCIRADPTDFVKSESATDIVPRGLEFSSLPAKMSASTSRLNLIMETPKNNTASVGRRSQDRFPFTISESASKKLSKFTQATMDRQADWGAKQERSLLSDRIISRHWNGSRRNAWDKFDIYPTFVQRLASRPEDSLVPEMISCVSYGRGQSEARNLVPKMKGFVRRFSAKLKRSTSKSRKPKSESGPCTKVLYENPECCGDSIRASSSNSYESERCSGQFAKVTSEGSKISSGNSLRSKRSLENVALISKVTRTGCDLENVQGKLHDDLWIQEFDSENEFDENVTVTSSPLWKEKTLKSSPVNSKDRYDVFLAKDELRATTTESCRKSVVDKSNERDTSSKKIKNAEDSNNSSLTSKTSVTSLINERVETTNDDNDLNGSDIETGCFCFKFCPFLARLFDTCKYDSSVSRSRLRAKKRF